jgi:ribonuclease-3
LPSLEAAEQFSASIGDHKSALQELLQAAGRGRPHYQLVGESGPDHRRVFRIEVRLEGESSDNALAVAEGSTKKQAQQEAARLAVSRLIEAAHG